MFSSADWNVKNFSFIEKFDLKNCEKSKLAVLIESSSVSLDNPAHHTTKEVIRITPFNCNQGFACFRIMVF